MVVLRAKMLGVACALATLSCISARPQTLTDTATSHNETGVITPNFIAFVEDVMKNGVIPGLSLAVMRSDGQVEHGAWGNKTEDGEPMTTDTLFNLASGSKAFLASSVGILMDDFDQGRNVTPLPSGLRKFDWSTKVADLLPGDWQLMDEWASAKANVRDILSHVSGVPGHDLSYKPTDTPLDGIRNLRNLRPAYELRETWSYNNIMYMLGSYLVSTYSGMPYTEFVSKRIFEPLNMNSTTFSATAAADKLTQSWSFGNRRIPFWFPDNVTELNAGPGGIISSADDMTNWLSTLLHAGVDPSSNTTIIPSAAFDEITTSQVIVEGAPPSPLVSIAGYGHGWARNSYRGHDVVSHPGGVPGFSTLVSFLPSDGLAVVVLINTNTDTGNEAQIITNRVIEDFLGLTETPPSTDSPAFSRRSIDSTTRTQHSERAVSGNLSLPLEAYTGTYSNAGYGNVTFCSPTGTSAYCKQVLAVFSHFEDVSPVNNTSSPDVLYAAFPAMWVSHLRLESQGNDTFSFGGMYLFPQGYGRDTSPYQLIDQGLGNAQFVVEAGKVVGMGLVGMFGETDRQEMGGTVEEISDVWFDKL